MKRLVRACLVLHSIVLLFAAHLLWAQGLKVTAIGPEGGIVNVVRGTTDDGVVLIGTRNNGVYRSVDGGLHWSPTFIPRVSVNDIVFHPTNSLIVYAATQQGLFRSVDAGSSWTLTSLVTPTSSFAFYPPAPLIMFAGDSSSASQGSNGVLKSIDGGVTWGAISNGLASRSITSVAVDDGSPVTGIVVYAGTDKAGVYQTSSGGSIWVPFINNSGLSGSALRIHALSIVQGSQGQVLTIGTSSGPYYSIAGLSWSPVTSGMADSVVQCVVSIVGTPQNPSVIQYVGTKGNEETFPVRPVRGGLYTMVNFGPAWTPSFAASLDVNGIFLPSLKPNKIYIATSDGVFISTDGGASWARSNAGLMGSFVRTVAPLSSNPDHLFAGVYGGGVLKSTNRGATWDSSSTGLDNPYVRVVVSDPKNNAVLYAGSVYGLYKSSNTGNSWQRLSLPNTSHDTLNQFDNNSVDGTLKLSPVDPQNLIVASLNGDFLSSPDGGVSWNILTAPQQLSVPYLVENLEFDPISAATVYFSANGIWKSTDLGKTWSAISGDLPPNAAVGGKTFPLLGIHPKADPNNPGTLYLPTIANGALISIYKTTNGGINWSTLNEPAFDVAIDPFNPAELVCAAGGGIAHSSDGGATWSKPLGDTSTSYYSISQIPSIGSFMYVGSNRGVSRIDAGGAVRASQTVFDFSTQSIGATAVKSISFTNSDFRPVTITVLSSSGSSDFTILDASPLILAPATTGTMNLQFLPKIPGSQQASITFASDEPGSTPITVSLHGAGIPKIAVKRTVLLETTHGVSANLGATSISNYLSGFVQSLQRSGITVQQNLSPFDALAAPFDAIIIAAPKNAFSLYEISRLQQYLTNGGFVVMLGDSGKSDANKRLNDLLSNFEWAVDSPYVPTGLSINFDVVTDQSSNYLGSPASPYLTAFVDPRHPFTKGVDTLVFFGGSSIAVREQAVAFLKGGATTIAVASDTPHTRTPQPVVAAMSQIGKGRIFLIGDVDIWSDLKGDPLSPDALAGILAGRNLQFALNVLGYTENYTVKVPSPTPSDQYEIISVPFDLDDFDILDVLKDLGSVDRTKWRLYGRWDGSEYLEFPSPGFLSFKRGEGYWLITKGEHALTLGSANISTSEGFFPIQLDSGYNLIGNPFPYRVSWTNSRRSNPDSVESWLWKFDGTGFQQERNVMEPFTGYFLKSLRRGVTIEINPADISSGIVMPKAKSTMREFAQGEWELTISASNGAGRDDDNIAGVLRSAKEEWDAEDFSEPPPAPTDYLVVSFNHGDWKNNPGRYAGDYRPVHQEGNYWDLDIASAKSEAVVTAEFSKAGNIPAGFEICLVDMTTERVTDITSSMSYQFKLRKNESSRALRLVVGTRKFNADNTNGIPIIPLAYSLSQNFPNPFNPSTTIQYVLGHSAHVELVVFNMLGQKVKTLYSGVKSLGTYVADWDGTNDNGQKVSTGIYIYRLHTEEFSDARKMVFLK